jgi:hypothetical protein
MADGLPRFVPEDLRQLARFVPRSGWDAIRWRPLLASLRTVSWRYASGRGVDGLAAGLAAALEPVSGQLAVGEWPAGAVPAAELSNARQRRRAGDELLRLYFAQWLLDDGLFLDLRLPRLALADGVLHYQPNGLWIRLRPEFREGMVALYRSFYSDDEGAFRDALRQMGLLREGLDAEAEAELVTLLQRHFGVDQRAQRFAIDSFKASFDELFAFFIAHRYRLEADFVFVGFYLITLYLSLERLGQRHDVRGICASVLLDDA